MLHRQHVIWIYMLYRQHVIWIEFS